MYTGVSSYFEGKVLQKLFLYVRLDCLWAAYFSYHGNGLFCRNASVNEASSCKGTCTAKSTHAMHHHSLTVLDDLLVNDLHYQLFEGLLVLGDGPVGNGVVVRSYSESLTGW